LEAVDEFWDAHGDKILKTVKFAWDAIKLYIDLAMAAVRVVIDVVMALIKGDWEGAWDAIVEYVGTVATLIKEFLATWGTAVVTLLRDIGKAIIEALINGIKSMLTAVKDIITGKESITSTIINGIKSIAPKAKSGGEKVSEEVAKGIAEKKSNVTAAADRVANTVATELDKAPPAAKILGNATSIAMADGLKSGTSVVSSAAKSVVDAAKIEMDRLWTLSQAQKTKTRSALDRASAKGSNVPKGTLDIVGSVIGSWSTTKYGYERVHMQKTGTIGKGRHLSETWEGDIEDITGSYYITEGAWNQLSEERQKAMADNIIAVLADDWKKSVTVGRSGGSKLYKRFIKESAFWSKEERYLADLQAKIDKATAEIEHLESLGVSPGTDLLSKLGELGLEMIQFNKYGMPSADTGGFVAQDTGLNAHKGEWVIPTRGGPIMTSGKDMTLNMTYNIGGVVLGSELERLLEKHDKELFKKLRALV
jgi:hypothetical protein